MGFFDRLANGWEIAKTSYKVLNANRQLIIFPILSGLSLAAVIGSFIGTAVIKGWDFDQFADQHVSRGLLYLGIFVFYIINYFVVVFFNMALMHCARLYFEGKEVSVSKGLQFSVSRIGAIFAWAVFAATVGTILKAIQDNAGWLGKIVIGLVGIVWSVTTFFVIPIIAYEDVGPIEALQRSGSMMKEKWGETIGANFSMGLVAFVGILLAGAIGTVAALINVPVGITLFVGGVFFVIAVSSALHSIFISAVYNQINGKLEDYFNQQTLDGLFVQK